MERRRRRQVLNLIFTAAGILSAAYYITMKMNRSKLHRIYRYLIDWLYPNICPCCNKHIAHDADFCESCKSSITRYTGSSAVSYTDGFAAFCVYDDFIRPAVLEFKKNDCGNTYYAFACGIDTAVKESVFCGDFDIIVPIPITDAKMSERGYNQTELIARELRFLMDIPYNKVLIKVKDTSEQKSLKGAAERKANTEDVFAVSSKAGDIKGKRILLIDDVCTTGSTLASAAKVLKEAGAGKVYAASFAKTEKKQRDTSENNTGTLCSADQQD